MNFSSYLYILDLIGIFACAVAASMLAKKKGMDFSGAVMVATLGSIGGGTVRDVLLARYPLFWLQDINYMLLITITAIVVQIFYFQFNKISKPVRWFDAIGLGAFSIIGFEAALEKGLQLPFVVLMGVITAVLGGICRDIICRELPLVLAQEIYILASVAGGLVYIGLGELGAGQGLKQLATLLVIVAIRMLSVYRDWNLPSITLKPKSPH